MRNIYSGHSGRAGFQALALRDAGFTGEADAAASVLGKIYGSAFDPGRGERRLGRPGGSDETTSSAFLPDATRMARSTSSDELANLGSRLSAVIERIDIETFFMAATMGQQSVRTPFGLSLLASRWSLPAAHRPRPGALTDDGTRAFADPAVEHSARVFVTEEKAATAAYPERQPTRMTVVMRR